MTAKAVILRRSVLLSQQKPLTRWLYIQELTPPAFRFYIRFYYIFWIKKGPYFEDLIQEGTGKVPNHS